MTLGGKVVTIDGPAGVGKSTMARILAEALGFAYLETGALYRAVAVAVTDQGLDQGDPQAVAELLGRIQIDWIRERGAVRILVNGRDVTDQLRGEEIGQAASFLSKQKEVRQYLNELQRRLATGGRVVVEGRDAGTVVFPEACPKFFLSASLEERVRRRLLQLKRQGIESDPGQVARDMTARDKQDESRDLAPLKPAEDAIAIDSSKLTKDQVKTIMIEAVAEGTRCRPVDH